MTWTALSYVVATILGLFAMRRVIGLFGAFRRPAQESPPHWPDDLDVLVLAPMRNEAGRAHFLLDALDKIHHPPGRLRIVLGDDASTDGTPARLTLWAESRPHVRLHITPVQIGKAALMNAMLASEPASLVAVYDAKHSPAPDSLARLITAMADPRTACASGYLEPRNARVTLVARYAALESWVVQLVDHQGREHAGISSPSMGGNCVYRRTAIDQAGGFAPGSYSEDTEMSLAMQGAGWRTRFIASARASNAVVETLAAFWNQRLRWNKGLYGATSRARRPASWVVVAGYLDRLALLAAVALAFAGIMPIWIPIGYAALPALVIAAALVKANACGQAPAAALSVLLLFPVDLAVTIWGTALAAARRAPAWR